MRSGTASGRGSRISVGCGTLQTQPAASMARSTTATSTARMDVMFGLHVESVGAAVLPALVLIVIGLRAWRALDQPQHGFRDEAVAGLGRMCGIPEEVVVRVFAHGMHRHAEGDTRLGDVAELAVAMRRDDLGEHALDVERHDCTPGNSPSCITSQSRARLYISPAAVAAAAASGPNARTNGVRAGFGRLGIMKLRAPAAQSAVTLWAIAASAPLMMA